MDFVTRGYLFYVLGQVPENKDSRTVDAKLIAKYDISFSRDVRKRRRRQGLANVRYARHERTFVLMATHGVHRFFQDEAGNFHDVRERPIRYGGYSLSYQHSRVTGRWHASVRIEGAEYRGLRRYFLDRAALLSVPELEELFESVPYEPYAPVRRQVFGILRAVNKVRKKAGQAQVFLPAAWVQRLRRRSSE